MANFETVVRPFQLPNVAPPKQYIAAKQQSQPPVMLYFGRQGSGRTFNGSFSSQTSYYQVQIVAEDKRGYSNVKYEAPSYSMPTYNLPWN